MKDAEQIIVMDEFHSMLKTSRRSNPQVSDLLGVPGIWFYPSVYKKQTIPNKHIDTIKMVLRSGRRLDDYLDHIHQRGRTDPPEQPQRVTSKQPGQMKEIEIRFKIQVFIDGKEVKI